MQILPQGETCQMAKLTHLEELQAPEVKIMVEFGLDERLQLYCRIGYHCTHTRCCFPNYAGTSHIAEAIPPSSIFGPHWVRRQAMPSYPTPAPGFLWGRLPVQSEHVLQQGGWRGPVHKSLFSKLSLVDSLSFSLSFSLSLPQDTHLLTLWVSKSILFGWHRRIRIRIRSWS